MTYDELLARASDCGLVVREKNLQSASGRISGSRIAIRRDIPTSVEKACVLAEEIGHYQTGVGDVLDQRSVSNRKQEKHARLYAYDMQIGLIGIIRSFEHGCRSKTEMAEYLGVTEKFLGDALAAYAAKYGVCTTIDNYTIYFAPALAVYRSFV